MSGLTSVFGPEVLDAEMLMDERLAIFVERLMRRDQRITVTSRKEFWT